MEIKRVLISAILIFLLAPVTRAQDVKTDSINGDIENFYEQNGMSQNIENADAQTVKSEQHIDKVWKHRSKYLNIFYGQQTLKNNSTEMNSDIALALTFGRTYYLHKKPIAGLMKFGLDWSFVDLNFAKYPDLPNSESVKSTSGAGLTDLGIMQFEVGTSIGPSFTINPVDQLKLNLYFHVTPSYSIIVQNEELYDHYATFFNVGFIVAYKAISLGIETRWNSATYYDGVAMKRIGEVYDSMGNFHDPFENYATKMKTNTLRFFLGFRF
jgi:hypothetical protein